MQYYGSGYENRSTALRRGVRSLIIVACGCAVVMSGCSTAEAQRRGQGIDMKEAGAAGDGKTIDTQIFQEVFGAGKAHPHPQYGQAREIYLPNGTYLVDDTIKWGDKKKKVIGESREGVIIKLTDTCAGFQDPDNPRALLDNEYGFEAQNFSQYVRNITIDVGKGNPGAIGIRLHTNNGGGMYNCTVRSSDPQGAGVCGIWMPKWPGPGVVRDVLVQGFDTGISIASTQYSWTFVDVTLRGQRVCGFRNEGNTVSIFRLHSDNEVPAVINLQGSAVMAMAQSRFVGGAPDTPAVINARGAYLFARDIAVQGYARAITDSVGATGGVAQDTVDAYSAYPYMHLFGDEPRPLDLSWEDPPEVPDGERSEWVCIDSFGARQGNYNDQDGSPDCGPAIQRAIDAGAEYVYLPEEGFYVSKTPIHIRNNLRKIFTLGAVLNFRLPAQPAWIVEDGTHEVVEVSAHGTYGDMSLGLEHASTRTLIYSGDYYNTVPGGKVYMQDFVADHLIFDRQKAWIVGLNSENYEHHPHVMNFGGDVFCVGHKTEKDRGAWGTYDGGRSMVLGGLLYKNRDPLPEVPAMIVDNAYATYVYRNKGKPYTKWVSHTKDDETRILAKQDAMSDIYSYAYEGLAVPRVLNPAPGTPIRICNVACRVRDPQADVAVRVHYRPAGAENYTAIDLDRDEYGRYNGSIPASVSTHTVEYFVSATEDDSLIATWPRAGSRAPARVLPDTTAPSLPGDPHIVRHDKFPYILSWPQATDRETRIRFYRLYRGATRQACKDSLLRVEHQNVHHWPFTRDHVAQGSWLAVQPVDYAGHRGELRYVHFTEENVDAFDKETSTIR